MRFPTPKGCQAEDDRILARISPLESEEELLAGKRTLDLVEKSGTQGMGALLDELCDAFQVVKNKPTRS